MRLAKNCDCVQGEGEKRTISRVNLQYAADKEYKLPHTAVVSHEISRQQINQVYSAGQRSAHVLFYTQ